jgi:hypothetical protein
MRVYKGTFVKKDGTKRTMNFVKTNDLPKTFLESKLKGNGNTALKEGYELVWDLQNDNFRVFNHNTVVGEVTYVATLESPKEKQQQLAL